MDGHTVSDGLIRVNVDVLRRLLLEVLLRSRWTLGEVVPDLERFDLEVRGLLNGESTLGLLDFALELAHGTEVGVNVGASLLLVLIDEVINDCCCCQSPHFKDARHKR